jgi:hypothetical protein
MLCDGQTGGRSEAQPAARSGVVSGGRWSRGVLAAAAIALAASAPSGDRIRVVEAEKVYPYLSRFMRMPPGQHDRFVLAYYAMANGRPATRLRLTFEAGPDRWPIPIAQDGLIEREPTVQELESDARVRVEGPDETALSITQEVHPNFPPARTLDADELRAALAQVTAASRRLAGPFGFAVPRLERAEFHGVGTGEAVYADGRTARLKLYYGNPYFDADMEGVKTLRFPRPPERIELEPKG